jgi:predicted SAM-dependent methyltransferase
MKINLGCGMNKLPGFVNIDANPSFAPDRIEDVRNIVFAPNSIDEVAFSHVLEHLPKSFYEEILKRIYSWLKPGAKLYISVPDLPKVCEAYLRTKDPFLLFWIYGSGEEDRMSHCWGFDTNSLHTLLTQIGFAYTEDFPGLGGDSSFVYDGVLLSINRIYQK